MNAIHVKIADCVVEIKSKYRFANNLCRDFRTQESPNLFIVLSDDDIDFGMGQHNPKATLLIKSSSLLRKMSDALLDCETILMHGAALNYNGWAYLFTAPSGTGKTTHVEKWLNHISRASIINGDKPFIKFPEDGGQPLACGSPWAGKENMYTNTMVPLKAIVLMERAEDNHIEEISFAEAFPKLLQQVYRPEDEEKMRKTLRLMQRLSPAVSFWRFGCNNFKDDCFDVAHSALVGKQG